MWLYSAARSKKSQEGQLTDCQEVWTMRQEGESMWLVSEYGPSVSSQNRMGLRYLMTCICKNICPHSKGSGTPYTVNGTIHASIWKSKICLVANSYEVTLSPPVHCWWAIRSQQSCEENKGHKPNSLLMSKTIFVCCEICKYWNRLSNSSLKRENFLLIFLYFVA